MSGGFYNPRELSDDELHRYYTKEIADEIVRLRRTSDSWTQEAKGARECVTNLTAHLRMFREDIHRLQGISDKLAFVSKLLADIHDSVALTKDSMVCIDKLVAILDTLENKQ